MILRFAAPDASNCIGASFDLYHPKLEEGTIATAWSSAEEDTNVKFEITNNSITSQVSAIRNNINTLQTDIDQTADAIVLTAQ
jgi:hypothetical protein